MKVVILAMASSTDFGEQSCMRRAVQPLQRRVGEFGDSVRLVASFTAFPLATGSGIFMRCRQHGNVFRRQAGQNAAEQIRLAGVNGQVSHINPPRAGWPAPGRTVLAGTP